MAVQKERKKQTNKETNKERKKNERTKVRGAMKHIFLIWFDPYLIMYIINC